MQLFTVINYSQNIIHCNIIFNSLSYLFLETCDYLELPRHWDVGLNTDETSPIDFA